MSPTSCASLTAALFGGSSVWYLLCAPWVTRGQTEKNWSWTASALVPDSATRILVLCPLLLLYFCSIPKCRVAGGDNAAQLILCLCTLAVSVHTIVCVAWEWCWMFGSRCLMIKGVTLLIEVSCTEICAYTLCNMCTVIFQAVLGLLHICCKNSLTTCSKIKCSEMFCVCTGATCLGFLGANMVKIFILRPDKMCWKRDEMDGSIQGQGSPTLVGLTADIN